MSRVAVLSDIHGNLPALESVLAEIVRTNAADDIVFGGDIVGYGASPAECIQIVRQVGGNCVLGNHEHYLNQIIAAPEPIKLDRINPVEAGLDHAINQLTEEDKQWISELPVILPITQKTIVAHASLHEPDQWHYLRNPTEAQPTLDYMNKHGLHLGFFGHIHTLNCFPISTTFDQHDKIDINDRTSATAITVGSVGQPRGDINDKRATWVIYDAAKQTIQVKRTEYNAKQAANNIIKAGLPESSARRLL